MLLRAFKHLATQPSALLRFHASSLHIRDLQRNQSWTLSFYAYDCESARESAMCSLQIRWPRIDLWLVLIYLKTLIKQDKMKEFRESLDSNVLISYVYLANLIILYMRFLEYVPVAKKSPFMAMPIFICILKLTSSEPIFDYRCTFTNRRIHQTINLNGNFVKLNVRYISLAFAGVHLEQI